MQQLSKTFLICGGQSGDGKWGGGGGGGKFGGGGVVGVAIEHDTDQPLVLMVVVMDSDDDGNYRLANHGDSGLHYLR